VRTAAILLSRGEQAPAERPSIDSTPRSSDGASVVPCLFVLVPFWNGEDLLERCLESLSTQTYPGTVVLIDDASAAPARELARAWCERAEGRVLVSRTHNGGPAAARHDGLRWILEHAGSERDVIVLLDGEDELAHPQALATIAAIYAADPRIEMTLGGHRRASGKSTFRRRYRAWHLQLHLARAAAWRARPPHTFRVGRLRRVWPEIRWRWPNGSWIRSAADVLLVLPMLATLRWHELAQLEEVLYVESDLCPDGTAVERSLRACLVQLCAEGYVRRSLTWFAVVLPRLLLSATRRQVTSFAGS
jgi:glycosyltransferase involved in cell wall biosynthesis